MNNGNRPVMGGKIPKSEREMQQEQALYKIKPDPYNYQKGLTIREHFAGLAMQGLISRDSLNASDEEVIPVLSVASVMMADALLKELSND